MDFFTADPGVCFYRFETGAITWQYDMLALPEVFYGMMTQRSKEILISNDALRNRGSIHGLMTAVDGVVLSPGERFISDKIFSGYGRIYLESVVVDAEWN